MGHLFYFIGIFIFLSALSNVINFNAFFKIKNWIVTFKKVAGKDPVKSDFRNKGDYNTYTTYTTLSSIESFWMLLGIVTQSWYVFISILLFNVLLNLILSIFKANFIEKILLNVYGVFKLLCILALVVNHFHFHFDWLSLIGK